MSAQTPCCGWVRKRKFKNTEVYNMVVNPGLLKAGFYILSLAFTMYDSRSDVFTSTWDFLIIRYLSFMVSAHFLGAPMN